MTRGPRSVRAPGEPPARRLRSAAIDLVRRGPATAWAPPWMNLGNLLYVGYWAFEGRRHGQRRRILAQPPAAAVAQLFPGMHREFFVRREDVPLLSRRVLPWSLDEQTERRGETYDPPHLQEYIDTILLPGSPVLDAGERDLGASLVVNVRRGDYFAEQSIRREYGMNTLAYVVRAVELAVDCGGAPRRIDVVSDDIPWCARELSGRLSRFAPVRLLEGDPLHDLAVLTRASRLVLANSTFSYWGGYLGDSLRPGREVWAPWLFSRAEEGGRAYQLRPGWNVVTTIPGGWDATGP